jgi:hypothetical protein
MGREHHIQATFLTSGFSKDLVPHARTRPLSSWKNIVDKAFMLKTLGDSLRLKSKKIFFQLLKESLNRVD